VNSSGNIRLTKIDFGFSEDAKDLFFRKNPDIKEKHNGSFHIVKRGESYYWYYRLSFRGKGNNKYICKAHFGKENGLDSFEDAQIVLRQRLEEGFNRKTTRNSQINNLIDEYRLIFLTKEIDNVDGRKDETLKSYSTTARQFQIFIEEKNLRLSDIQNIKGLKLLILDYIDYMKKRELTRWTRMTYLKGVKAFLQWLADDIRGKGVLTQNPLSTEVLKDLHPITSTDRQDKRQTRYNPKGYVKMYTTCLHKVGDIWSSYLKKGLEREYTNQPVGVGSDLTYFVSLIQLGRGFRLGEILFSYRDRESWENRLDKKNSSSYWYKHNDVWFLHLDWKGKISNVPIDGEYAMVRTFGEDVKPHDWKGEPTGEMFGKPYFDTHIIDVCKNLFRDSDFLFSSPNYRSHFRKPYSKSHYSNIFKQKMVHNGTKGEGWENYDVLSSHDLRDYFISECIHSMKLKPEELAQITRHSVSTMMKYYKRDSEETQQAITSKIEIKIKSRKVVRKEESE